MSAEQTSEAMEWVLASALFLGLLQGLTEFLPVSSSGHLVLFQQFLPVQGDEVLFDVVLHLGTLVPVLFFYRRTLWEMMTAPFVGSKPILQRDGVRLMGLVILATIPTGLIGVLFQDVFEAWFANPSVLVVTFSITGALLFFSRRFNEGKVGLSTMTVWMALALGVAQGLAITPGISRSGTTITVALMFGLKRELAARFSFLMSIPAICGAVLLKLKDADLAELDPVSLGVGGITALVSGYFALVLLVWLVKRGRLSGFAWYCWAAAAAAGAIAIWRATA